MNVRMHSYELRKREIPLPRFKKWLYNFYAQKHSNLLLKIVLANKSSSVRFYIEKKSPDLGDLKESVKSTFILR